MSSDPKNCFVFLVDEISEPGLTIAESVDTAQTEYSKYSLNESRLKASFRPIESI